MDFRFYLLLFYLDLTHKIDRFKTSLPLADNQCLSHIVTMTVTRICNIFYNKLTHCLSRVNIFIFFFLTSVCWEGKGNRAGSDNSDAWSLSRSPPKSIPNEKKLMQVLLHTKPCVYKFYIFIKLLENAFQSRIKSLMVNAGVKLNFAEDCLPLSK